MTLQSNDYIAKLTRAEMSSFLSRLISINPHQWPSYKLATISDLKDLERINYTKVK